ncbi:hypothetical protein [Paraeggerthella sp.]|uniref:amino acid kinase family protein n=1 Tax=Paraeggerthella sp. TaxID=2897350 RepID=UPI0035279EDA
MSEEYRYKRVLLKLSGEALAGDVGYGIDPKVVDDLADQIADIVRDGVQLAVVVGGGNIFRGPWPDRPRAWTARRADYIGMLATVMNSLALQDAFERHGIFLARAKRHQHAGSFRALHSPPRHPPHGEGPRGHFGRRHGQPVLHH